MREGKATVASRARIPDDETLRRITTRAVAEIVPHQEFEDALRSGRTLRLKMGFDPTKPVITLGWAVGLRKLRQLQDLGHTVVVIIGDWTARIGDPSGASQTRPMLTAEEVQANSEAILRQFYKVLDESRTEIRRQSEWFDGFSLTDVVRLAARFTVAQVLQRDDFAQRYAGHKPIGLHELLYPLLQAYDSVAVEADVEFGGTDQKFNNLMGRELQRMLGQRAGPAGDGQAVFLVPLLVGLDGQQKMSQSLGNYIAIDDPPHEMYGKLMSIPDALMIDYFELLTDVPDEELAYIRRSLEERTVNPMEHKMRLAREIVTQFHSREAAREAEEGFVRTFRKRETPEETVREVMIPPALMEAGEAMPDVLPNLLKTWGVVPSVSEGRRLLRQGAVEINGEKVGAKTLVKLRSGATIRVGKHRFLRIVDLPAGRHGADKQPRSQ
ncbi:MAG: tyrosine--tRNA ligase [Chloroflexi bacterium RBG_16_64_32]|nr:MAG: tyrosine--tRNA ligase [Chloroflexi bacterium RBG_16_64_32]